jgi:hypothetical protein
VETVGADIAHVAKDSHGRLTTIRRAHVEMSVKMPFAAPSTSIPTAIFSIGTNRTRVNYARLGRRIHEADFGAGGCDVAVDVNIHAAG